MKQSKNKIYRISILGILTAIIILQNFIPFLGYIPIPPLNPTIIHITVIVAAFVLGTKEGMIVGGVWGLVRLVKAFTLPASPLDLILFTNPLISVVPRIAVGLTAGLTMRFFRKRNKEKWGMVAGGIVGSLTNTLLVLGFIALFYGNEYADALGVNPTNLMKALAAIVATNGIAEAVAAAILAPAFSRPLMRIRRK